MSEQPPGRPAYPPGTLRIGSIGGVDVLVRASWLVIALLIAYLVAPQVEVVQPGLGSLKYVAGLAFAVLLYLSVLLHEMSHALAAQAFGLPVRSISLHFLGGATEIEGEPRTPGQEFVIAVVGPLTSIAIGLVCLGLLQLRPPGLLGMATTSLAGVNLVVGVLNLVPGLPLDGGRVLRALVWKVGHNPHRGTVVAAWGGRVAAVLALAWPFVIERILHTKPDIFDYLVGFCIAAFLWSGANASLLSARVREGLVGFAARPLARRAIAVPEELSVAEAVRRAQEAGAGGIVVHTGDDRLSAVVDEQALLAAPDERRPWMPISTVARSLETGLVLPADIAGEELLRAMAKTPAPEYVLVEGDGSVYGVLSTNDVDRAFNARAGR
ncbi:MAG: site-2 protease family protein [Actinomycetota bacterium]|nr:site-2 protease family protein [Actinomycetota bacterium]